MNGRVYDPVLGRFLSADPFVDDATTAGAYNRYAYCGNDPLGQTDPSGYFSLKNFLGLEALMPGLGIAHTAKFGLAPWNVDPLYYAFPKTYAQYAPTVAGIAASVVVGIFTCGSPALSGAAGGFVSSFYRSLLNGGAVGDAFRSGVEGAAYGAATAVLSAGIGKAFGPSGSFANEVGRATAHGVVGGAIAEMQGGEFRHGFISSAASSAIMHSGVTDGVLGSSGDGNPQGIACRTMVAAAIGGTVSVISGGKFANGAITAAFQQLFNAEGKNLVSRAYDESEVVDEGTYEQNTLEIDLAADGADFAVQVFVPEAGKVVFSFLNPIPTDLGSAVQWGIGQVHPGVGELVDKVMLPINIVSSIGDGYQGINSRATLYLNSLSYSIPMDYNKSYPTVNVVPAGMRTLSVRSVTNYTYPSFSDVRLQQPYGSNFQVGQSFGGARIASLRIKTETIFIKYGKAK